MNYKLLSTVILLVLLKISQTQVQSSIYYPVEQGNQLSFQVPKLFKYQQFAIVSPLVSQQQINFHICFPKTQVKPLYQQISSISSKNQNQTNNQFTITSNFQQLFTLRNHIDSVYVQQWLQLFVLLKDDSLQVYSVQNDKIKLTTTNKLSSQLKKSKFIQTKIESQIRLFLVSQNQLLELTKNGKIIQTTGFDPLQEALVDVEFSGLSLYFATQSAIQIYQVKNSQIKKIQSYKISLTEGELTSIQQIIIDHQNKILYVADNQFGIVALNLTSTINKNSIQAIVINERTNCHSLAIYQGNLIALCPNLVTISASKVNQCFAQPSKDCSHLMKNQGFRLGYLGRKILVNQTQIIVVGHKNYQYLYALFDNKTNQLIISMRGLTTDLKQKIQNSFIYKNYLIFVSQKKFSMGFAVPQKMFINCNTKNLKYKTSQLFSGKLTGNITVTGACSDLLASDVSIKKNKNNLCSKIIPLILQISTVSEDLYLIQIILVCLLTITVLGAGTYLTIKKVRLMKRFKHYQDLIQQNQSNKSKRINTEEVEPTQGQENNDG